MSDTVPPDGRRGAAQTAVRPSPGDGDEGHERTQDAAPTGGPRTRWVFDNKILPWLLIGPALLVIFGLVGWPLIQTIWLSFTDASRQWVADGTLNVVWLDNYLTVVTDSGLRAVAIRTAVFGLACVVGTMVLGIAAALLLNERFVGNRVLLIIVLTPWAVAPIAAAVVWEWLVHYRYGLITYWVNVVRGWFGLDPTELLWQNSQIPAFTVIGIVVVWQAFPFVTMSLLAGLQSISSEIIDAARVDGASPWQRVRYITLPMLKPLIMVLIIISTIWDFRLFDQIFQMTRGGPAGQTETIALRVYNEAFASGRYGMAATLAVALFIVLALITLFYLWVMREEEDLS